MKWLAFALLLLPATASARQGTVRYDRAIRYEFTIPERMDERLKAQIATQSVTSMVLAFDEATWVIRPADGERRAPAVMTDRPEGLTLRLKMGSTSRSDQETLLETHVDAGAGTVTETREFMGRTFLITGDQPSWAWKLTGEQSQYLGYTVQKATAMRDSLPVEAWFTAEIPVPAGPAEFGGLPGLILVVTVGDGRTTYSAKEVHPGPLETGALAAPREGEKVTREEYEKIVAEKMKELTELRGRRRDVR